MLLAIPNLVCLGEDSRSSSAVCTSRQDIQDSLAQESSTTSIDPQQYRLTAGGTGGSRTGFIAGLLVYAAQGKYDDAEVVMREALDIDKQAFGSQHPTVAIDISNLASLLFAKVSDRGSDASLSLLGV